MSSPMSGDNTNDRVLQYCQHRGIHTVEDSELPAACHSGGRSKTVRIGNIAFRSHSHDTGCDVRGWIIDGAEAYEFVSTTYWYSSHYTFNSSKWERGAWDVAVEQFFATLRAAKAESEARALETQEQAAERRRQEAAQVKARFERQFSQSN